MMNENIFLPLLPLKNMLPDIVPREFGWLLSTRNLVEHGNKEQQAAIQKSVNRCIQGILIVYLFALWEEYVPRNLEENWLSSSERERLRAFRHIRHSFAHGFGGARANQCRSEFENVMKSTQPFAKLNWDNNKIELCDSQIALDCQRHMEDLSNKLVDRIARDESP